MVERRLGERHPDAPTGARTWTENVTRPGGGTFYVKRACNGCGRLLGDPIESDVDPRGYLTDVRDECGCSVSLDTVLAEHDLTREELSR